MEAASKQVTPEKLVQEAQEELKDTQVIEKDGKKYAVINKGLDAVLKKIIKVIFSKHTKHEYDSVFAITGDEGSGKSTLAIWILHYYLLELKGEVNSEDARYMCLDKHHFATILKGLKKFGAIVYDETDFLSRRSMGGYNVGIMKAYQIIRGDCLLTLLVLPSLWDLDTFFRKRRIRGLFHVPRRGYYKFWSKTRLRKLVALNESLPYKNLNLIKPTHKGWFSKYNGPMEDKYRDNKADKMKKVRSDLYKSITAGKDVNQERKKTFEAIIRMEEMKIRHEDIAKALGIHRRTIYEIKKAFKQETVA